MRVQIGKKYRHYRNNKEYKVLTVGYFTESDPLLECVIYQALYNTEDLGDKPVFIRPREMFEEQVNVNGQKIDRFQLVKNESA